LFLLFKEEKRMKRKMKKRMKKIMKRRVPYFAPSEEPKIKTESFVYYELVTENSNYRPLNLFIEGTLNKTLGSSVFLCGQKYTSSLESIFNRK